MGLTVVAQVVDQQVRNVAAECAGPGAAFRTEIGAEQDGAVAHQRGNGCRFGLGKFGVFVVRGTLIGKSVF